MSFGLQLCVMSTVATYDFSSNSTGRFSEWLACQEHESKWHMSIHLSWVDFIFLMVFACVAAPAMSQNSHIPQALPIRQNNPWASPFNPTDAESWLASSATVVASSVDPFTGTPNTPPVTTTAAMNGTVSVSQHQQLQQQVAGDIFGAPQFSPVVAAAPAPAAPHQRAPHLGQLRSHSVDPAQLQGHRAPTLSQISQQGAQVPQFQSQQHNGKTAPTSPACWGNNNVNNAWSAGSRPQGVDPFDAAWVAKGRQPSTNPFQANATTTDTVTKAFEVNL